MIITTTESIPGKEIKEVYGIVTASTVRSKNIGKDIYITDALFDDGENLEEPCAVLVKNAKPEYVRVESNNGGGFFKKQLQKKIDTCSLMSSTATTNKEARIRSAAGFIKKYCLFVDPKYQTGDYKKFFENLTKYTKNGKGIKHDDAPDSMAGLARMITGLYPSLYEDFAGANDLAEPE